MNREEIIASVVTAREEARAEAYAHGNPAGKIQDWRDDNPGEMITEQVLFEILGVGSLRDADLRYVNLADANLAGVDLIDADLAGVDLRYANLTGAHLTGANLTNSDLRYADLTYADLRGCDLIDADLTDANLIGCDLTGANLIGANLRYSNLTNASMPYFSGGVAQVSNVYPYPATIQPTPNGWYARVGCWCGTLDELHKIATSDNDDDWPEATGAERERRRPLLKAILAVFDAHVANHPDVIDQLRARWGDRA